MKNINNFKLQKELLKEARKDLRIVKAKMIVEHGEYAKVYKTKDNDAIDAKVKEIEDRGLIHEWRAAMNTINMSSFRMKRIIRRGKQCMKK